jgi:hypothetical protein
MRADYREERSIFWAPVFVNVAVWRMFADEAPILTV